MNKDKKTDTHRLIDIDVDKQKKRQNEAIIKANEPVKETVGEMMKRSEVPNDMIPSKFPIKISMALSRIQGKMEGAKKTADNPFFKSKYADLAEVWSCIRPLLAEEKIAIWQLPHVDYENQVEKTVVYKDYQGNSCSHKSFQVKVPTITVKTILVHESGETMENDLHMTPNEDTPQAIGSCITYGRRYSIMPILGVAPEEDDGNSASQKTQPPKKQAQPPRQQQQKKAQPPKPRHNVIRDEDGKIRFDINRNLLNDKLQEDLGMITTPMYRDLETAISTNFGGIFKDFEAWLQDSRGVKFYDIPSNEIDSVLNEMSGGEIGSEPFPESE